MKNCIFQNHLEKFLLMELESPAWHADVLRETAARVERGEEKVLEWEAAKLKLRQGAA